MSPYDKGLAALEWIRTWVQYQLLPYLGFDTRTAALGVLRGTFDTLLLLLLGFGLLAVGRSYMNSQYEFPRSIQASVLKWAPVADQIARDVDVPREVPLVLWYKENSMKAENPASCTGIIGAYDLVRSGERPCFTPGPISDFEVRDQLALAAVEFKKRCPEISYLTQDPETIKRCYFAYNAGAGAAKRLDPDRSAYVMNNFNEDYQNMVYSDVELGTVRVESMGAWPTHLAFQSMIISQWDDPERPFSIALLEMSTRVYDTGANLLAEWTDARLSNTEHMPFPAVRDAADTSCLGEPHTPARPFLRPRLNPVSDGPILTQDLHGCSYSLPGVDISSFNRTAVLQAPMPGEVTTYTDRWNNSTIRIENDAWIVWMLHPRSYFVEDGDVVRRGQQVGVMGAVGYATGPHVHYTIYDKINETFVDPRTFLP